MKVEFCWCEVVSGKAQVQSCHVQVPDGGPVSYAQAIALAPEHVQSRFASGHWTLASFGQRKTLESLVSEGERIELLGPITIDVRAARVARVRAARAKESGPYNRSFQPQRKA